MCVDAVGSVKCFEWSIRFEKCSTNAVHLPFSAIRVQIRMFSIRDIESTFTFRLKGISKMLRSSFTDPTSYCQLDFFTSCTALIQRMHQYYARVSVHFILSVHFSSGRALNCSKCSRFALHGICVEKFKGQVGHQIPRVCSGSVLGTLPS